MIYEYVRWNYQAEDEEDTVQYPLGYFFSGDNTDADYILTASAEQTKRQLFAQYPPQEVLARSAVMGYYPDDVNEKLNQMWINVRCFNFDQVPWSAWLKALVSIGLALLVLLVFIYRYKIFTKPIKLAISARIKSSGASAAQVGDGSCLARSGTQNAQGKNRPQLAPSPLTRSGTTEKVSKRDKNRLMAWKHDQTVVWSGWQCLILSTRANSVFTALFSQIKCLVSKEIVILQCLAVNIPH